MNQYSEAGERKTYTLRLKICSKQFDKHQFISMQYTVGLV